MVDITDLDETLEAIREDYPDTITFDDLDDSIIGIASQWSKRPLVVYDREKMIQHFMKENGWTYEEGEEWVGYNVDQVWAGDGTPLIMVPLLLTDANKWRRVVPAVIATGLLLGVLAAAGRLAWKSRSSTSW